MLRLTLTIPGTPKGKARPRAGAGGHFYTPKETEAEEAHIRNLARRAIAELPPALGPVKLTLDAVFEIPVSWPPRVRAMRILPHISKPDLDNVEKLVLDALNGVAWHDDAQVCEVVKSKRYGESARIEVAIEEMATTVDHPALKRATKRAAEPETVTRRTQRRKPKREAKPRPAAPLGKRLR